MTRLANRPEMSARSIIVTLFWQRAVARCPQERPAALYSRHVRRAAGRPNASATVSAGLGCQIGASAPQTGFVFGAGNGITAVGNHFYGAGTGINVGSGVTAGLVADNGFQGVTTSIVNASTGTVIKDPVGLAFASLPSAAANGSQIFVTNGAPGSSPCTGASTGSTAFRQNGAWKCF